jgi:rfaE bifunctional protein nucleotidyltransferase chain/domain
VLGSDAVLVADYGGAVSRHPVVREVLRRQAAAVPVVWDPHPRGLGPVPGVRVVTPNRAEALGFAGALGDQSLDLVASRLRGQWQVEGVVVTDGARGAVVADGTAATLRCGAPACPPSVDTCGAGDRFAVCLALGLAQGSALSEAVRHATVEVAAWLTAGGVSLAASGGSSPSDTASGADAAASRAAEDVVQRVRAAGGTVVATGGCFDVLHTGHLRLLQTARDLGDCLVVVLNSDASTRRLKGPDRPVNPAADRARLLEALRCVDAVVVFEDDEPSATLARLRPDVWVKGGDYRRADLPEAAVVEAYGGSVRVVPFLAGRSSTSLLRRLVGASGV